MPRSKLTFWGPIRRRPAVEATLAMGLTIGLVTAIDQIGDGLVASMGAFSILYFVDVPASKRILNTAAVAAALIAASILGALCGANELMLVALLAVVAGVVSILTQATAAGPPGALMFVVATGASAHLAAGTFPVKRVGYLVAFGGVVSVAIVLATGWFQQKVSGATAQAQWNWSRVNAAHVLRLIIAAALGGVLCVALHTDRPYWAAAAAVAVLSASEARITMSRAFYRFFGTCAGVGVFSLIEWTDPKGLWLCISIAILQGLGEALMAANYAAAMAFITPVALLIASTGASVGATTSQHGRLVDTFVGAAAALFVELACKRPNTLARH